MEEWGAASAMIISSDFIITARKRMSEHARTNIHKAGFVCLAFTWRLGVKISVSEVGPVMW